MNRGSSGDAEAMGVSEIMVRQHAQLLGSSGSRVIRAARLKRLQDAAKKEAAELVMTAMNIVDVEDGR